MDYKILVVNFCAICSLVIAGCSTSSKNQGRFEITRAAGQCRLDNSVYQCLEATQIERNRSETGQLCTIHIPRDLLLQSWQGVDCVFLRT
ncbi:MAG: hypothetical protein ACI9SP_002450 [Arenicella sp.]|jgi:hypothetical protein